MRKFFNKDYRSIKKLLQEEKYLEAGEICMRLQDYEKAAEVFHKGEHAQEEAHALYKDKQWKKSADLYFEHGQELKAAEIFFANKQINKADRIYRDFGRFKLLGEKYYAIEAYEKAASCFLEAKNYELAAKALLKMDKIFEAVVSLQKAYQTQKELQQKGTGSPAKLKKIGLNTANLLKLTRQYKKAAELYIELEEHKEALECYSQIKDYESAARLAEKMDDFENAALYWKLSGNLSKYQKFEAERLAKRGKLIDAATKFLAANELARAADIYLQLKDLSKAASLYEKASVFGKAASCYELLGKYEKAARLYEKNEDFKKSIDCYQLTRLFEKEILLRTQIADYLGIAKRYLDMQQVDKALDILSQIKPDHPEYTKALQLKAKSFLNQNQIDLAYNSVKEIMDPNHTLEKIDIHNLQNLSKTKKYHSFVQTYINQKIEAEQIDKNYISQAQQLSQALEQSNVDNLAKQEMPSLEHMIHQYNEPVVNNPNGSDIRYQKIKEIGRGGMGQIYLAKDMVLGRTVALKLLSSRFQENKQSVDTFIREAKSAALLNHPNIVTVYDFGLQENEYYIAMEYIDGPTLKLTLRKQAKPNMPQGLTYFLQMLNALEYAHKQDIVHRDLSSSNIMFTPQKNIKIMDFGLAKMVKDLMSEQSIIGGTPSFMSPEQTLGDPIDHRTDIYSLGIILYELLTLELPFKKGDLGYHHLHTKAPLPSEANKNIPKKLDEFILTCMQKKQEQRFQSIAEMKHFLAHPDIQSILKPVA